MTQDNKPVPAKATKKRARKPPPIVPGKPKKKQSKLQQQALGRVSELTTVRSRDDPDCRLVGEVALTRKWVDAAHLDAEPLLQDLMWVEYRYMGPWQRTERFADEYVAAYRRAHAARHGARAAAKKRPLSGPLAFCSPDEINALHRARAEADALGVPYDIYCDVVIEGHLRNDKWRQPPRPNQMFGKLAAPRLRGRPTRSEIHDRLLQRHWDLRFFVVSDQSDPAQEAAWKLLREDVHGAPDSAACLTEHMRYRRSVSEAKARAMFGNDLVDEALASGGSVAPWRVATTPAVRTPSCYGFPSDAPDGSCSTCPVKAECRQVDAAARQELIATTGTDDPRKARQRELARDRQRRCRERKRQQEGHEPAAGPEQG